MFQLICHYGSWKVKVFSYISVATFQTKVCKDKKTIDALIDNGIHGQPMRNSHDSPTNLFLMLLKEKKEDFVNIYSFILISFLMSILIVCYTSNLFDKKNQTFYYNFGST